MPLSIQEYAICKVKFGCTQIALEKINCGLSIYEYMISYEIYCSALMQNFKVNDPVSKTMRGSRKVHYKSAECPDFSMRLNLAWKNFIRSIEMLIFFFLTNR